MDGLLAASMVMAVLSVAAARTHRKRRGFCRLATGLVRDPVPFAVVMHPTGALAGRARVLSLVDARRRSRCGCGIPVVRIPALHQLSTEAEHIQALAPCLPLHATMMQVNLDAAGDGSPRLNPMAEQSGAITVPARPSTFSTNPAGSRSTCGATPIAPAPTGLSPLGGAFDEVPTPIDLGAAIDHGLPLTGVVVIWPCSGAVG